MIIDENTEIKFTEVVFAVGSVGPFPGNSTRITSEDIKTQYVELSEAIKKSKKIVIIGGKLHFDFIIIRMPNFGTIICKKVDLLVWKWLEKFLKSISTRKFTSFNRETFWLQKILENHFKPT